MRRGHRKVLNVFVYTGEKGGGGGYGIRQNIYFYPEQETKENKDTKNDLSQTVKSANLRY